MVSTLTNISILCAQLSSTNSLWRASIDPELMPMKIAMFLTLVIMWICCNVRLTSGQGKIGHRKLIFYIPLHSLQLASPSPSLPLVITLLGRPTAWSALLLWPGQLISQLSPGWVQWTTQFPLGWLLQLVTWALWHLIHWQPLILGPTHVEQQ